MRTDEHVADATRTDYSALKEIDGIGRVYAQALWKTGIKGPADLTQYTPRELSKALRKKAHKTVKPEKIANENWIGQARDMTQRANTDASTGNAGDRASQAVTSNASSSSETEFTFSVSFERVTDEHGKQLWEATAYDAFRAGLEQPFEKYKDFETIESTEWVDWILRQMRQYTGSEPARSESEATRKPTPSEAKAGGSSAPEAKYDAQIEIRDAQISLINAPIGVWTTSLMAKVHFQISGSEASLLTANRNLFRIEVHAVNQESGASNLLVSRQDQLEPGKQDYSAEQAFLVPEIGRYRFHVIVLLLPPGEMMATHRSDPFDVVPYRWK